MQLREYAKNEVIFFRNDPSLAVYVVKSGKIGLAFDVQEEWEYIHWYQEGASFGESSLLANTKRIVSAVSISSKTELYVWPQESLFELLAQDMTFKLQIMENLCRIQYDFEQKIFIHYRRTSGFFDIQGMFD